MRATGRGRAPADEAERTGEPARRQESTTARTHEGAGLPHGRRRREFSARGRCGTRGMCTVSSPAHGTARGGVPCGGHALLRRAFRRRGRLDPGPARRRPGRPHDLPLRPARTTGRGVPAKPTPPTDALYPLQDMYNAHADLVPARVDPTIALCGAVVPAAAPVLMWFASSHAIKVLRPSGKGDRS